MEKITIYKIAEKAGVSPKTVSRVINMEPTVSKKTYERVYKIIKETNFLPNISAQRLASNKIKAIGLVIPRIGSPYASELISVILNKCKEFRYISVVYPMDSESKEYKDVLALYLQRHVDGFIIAPPGGDDEFFLNNIKEYNIPTILITPNRPYKDFYIVKAADKDGGYQATKYLIDLGHKRIGIITCDLSRTFSQERLEGYKQALIESNVPIDIELIKNGDNSFRSGFSAAKQLISGKNPPTAIFACNDEMALGVESAIYKLGLRIPDDFSLIGFDDIPLISELSVPLTTIRQPVRDIGGLAVALLIKLIKVKKIENKIYEIPIELIVRNSCKSII
jgi:LacI family transcriptional regulator